VVVPRDRFSTVEKCIETILANTPEHIDLMVIMGGTPEKLKKRLEEPFVPWGRKQNNAWDKATRSVYNTLSWEQFKNHTANWPKDKRDYALNRWFNYWSAMGIEMVFCSLPQVQAAKDQFDRLKDFSIQGINFDHKTSVFPKSYSHSIWDACRNPYDLIKWLYANQSQEQRYHLSNRLFVIVYDDSTKAEHWKIKAELTLVSQKIKLYVKNFNPNNLIPIEVNKQNIVSDIIWIIKSSPDEINWP